MHTGGMVRDVQRIGVSTHAKEHDMSAKKSAKKVAKKSAKKVAKKVAKVATPETPKVVTPKLMSDLADQGMTPYGIAKHLLENGYKRDQGKMWRQPHVIAYLDSECPEWTWEQIPAHGDKRTPDVAASAAVTLAEHAPRDATWVHVIVRTDGTATVRVTSLTDALTSLTGDAGTEYPKHVLAESVILQGMVAAYLDGHKVTHVNRGE